MMSHIDLCSGVGGFALGFEQAELSTPVLFCDIEPWSRKILAKHWPRVPIAEDVKELANDPDGLIPDTDPRNTILTAGYPCQPFSGAGKRLGTEDPRHIYPYISRIIAHKRPAWVVLENVYGHLSLGLDEVLNDLESKEYTTRTFILPSGAIVGAPHKRDRLWIIANTRREHGSEGNATELDKEQAKWASRTIHSESSGERQSDATDTKFKGSQGRLSGWQNTKWQSELGHARCSDTAHRQSAEDPRTTESSLCGMDDGLSSRLDGFDGWHREPEDIPRVAVGIKDRTNRLKGLGNAILPQIAQRIGEVIKAQHDRG